MHHFFAYVNRTKYITRWGLMKNTEVESLSTHLYQTSVLAHALALIENKYYGGNFNSEKIALCALYHDLPEIITGDLPTPVKYYNDEIKTAYKKIEDETSSLLIDKLPDELKEDYSDILYQKMLTDKEKRLLKAADTLSAYIKCMDEMRSDNRDFYSASVATEKKLEKIAEEFSSVSYFLNEFLGSFDLTIDEMR